MVIAGGVQMTNCNGEVHRLLSFAIESKDAEDRADLQQQLKTFMQAHPAFRIEVNALETGLIVWGEDELQLLEIRREIALQSGARIGDITIGYKESIRRSAEAEGRYIRQTGGSGNYGHCKIRLEPKEPGRGYEFINEIKGGVVPKEYIKSIDQGIQGAMEGGVLAGFPVVDVKATLFDGSYHEVDSNEMAFTIAGSMGFKEAATKASPLLLEPVMAVEIEVPLEFVGAIVSEVNSRRGRIEGMEPTAGTQSIRAIIPLAEVLSSSEHGRPGYAMHFAGYQPAPPRGNFGDNAGAYARKPRSPKPRAGSEAAEVDD
jgi:elongation factor G